jgi:hypothetical protein
VYGNRTIRALTVLTAALCIASLHASELPDNVTLKETQLLRIPTRSESYTDSPYLFTMLEGNYLADSYTAEAGIAISSSGSEKGVGINHLSVTWYGDDYDLRAGKSVVKLGVLDHMSTLDTVSPYRGAFFDDPNVYIRRIPEWMAAVNYYYDDRLQLKGLLQAYDRSRQDLSSFYLRFVLDSGLPLYMESLSRQTPAAEALTREIFLPVYNESISPALYEHIRSKYDGDDGQVDQMLVGVTAEYVFDTVTAGAVWVNRYGEVPLVVLDENLTAAAEAYGNGEAYLDAIYDYLEQNDLDPIKGMEGYRYNMWGAYFETTYETFGIRGEVTLRDKVPALSRFSTLSTVGLGIDTKSRGAYHNLEFQWVRLGEYDVNMLAGILATFYDWERRGALEWRFSHYLMMGYYGGHKEIALHPELLLRYEPFELQLQLLISKKSSRSNTGMITLGMRF